MSRILHGRGVLLSGLLLCALFFLGALPARAAINEILNYQGVLKNAGGDTVPDGNYDMVFRIYTQPSGGSPIWTGTYTAANGDPVSVANGLFSARLGEGAGNSLSGTNFDQGALYLGITVGGDAEMTPRLEIGAAAYAFDAQELDGHGVAQDISTPGSALFVDAGGLLDATSSLLFNTTGDAAFSAKVGIGTTSPAYALDVGGDINFTGQLLHDGVAVDFNTGSAGLAGATYAGLSFDTSGQAPIPFGMAFGDGGTKLYVSDGFGGTVIYQYTLGTPYDIATASYDDLSFDAADQVVGTTAGIAISSDGTKLFVSDSDTILYQYTLATPWDISSASYDDVSLDESESFSGESVDVSFGDGGSRLYVTDYSHKIIYEYDLGTPYDLSTAVFNEGNTLDLSGQFPGENEILTDAHFSPDGSTLYAGVLVYSEADYQMSLYEYTVGTPWDPSTAQYDGGSYNLNSVIPNPAGLFMLSDDGTAFYASSAAVDESQIFQFAFGTGSDSLSPWTKSGSVVSYTGGDVGIGTTTTHAALDIQSAGEDGLEISDYGAHDWVEASFINDLGDYGYAGEGGSSLDPAYADRAFLESSGSGVSLIADQGDIRFYADGENDSAERARISESGELGVATLAAGTSNSLCFNTSDISGLNTLATCSSDERLKQDIAPLNASTTLDQLLELNPVSFEWNPQFASTTDLQFGLIAQDVQLIWPNLISSSSPTALTPGGTLSLNFNGLFGPIISSVQEIARVGGAFEANLIAWLGQAQNGIGDLFAGNLHAQNELCVGDTCVSPAQFEAMVAAAQQSQTRMQTEDQGGGAGAPPQDAPNDAVATSADDAATSSDDAALATSTGDAATTTADNAQQTDPTQAASADDADDQAVAAPDPSQTAPSPDDQSQPTGPGDDSGSGD